MKKTNKGFDNESALYESVYNAIHRSQGVIEFELDGTIDLLQSDWTFS